jgi:hypothetical protein
VNSVPAAKRTSGEAAFDASLSSESPDSDSDPSSRKPNFFYNGRPIKPMPKRVKTQPTTLQTALDSFQDVCLRAARAGTFPAPPVVHNGSPRSISSFGTTTTPTGRNRRVRVPRYLSPSSGEEFEFDRDMELSDSDDSSTSRRSSNSTIFFGSSSPSPSAFRRLTRRAEPLGTSSAR